jgi:hypothetical protein
LITYIGGLAYTLLPVTPSDLTVLRALDRIWAEIREQDPAVPAASFELTPGRSSSCSNVDWQRPVIQVNLQHEGQTRSASDLLLYLIHMAAHGATGGTTSSEGKYHGAGFRDTARKLGLDAEFAGKGTGYSDISLATGTMTRYREGNAIAALEYALKSWEPVVVRRARRGSVKLVCSCSPARIIFTSQGNASGPGIRCEACGELFTVSVD